MNLHEYPNEFHDLIVETAAEKHLPESAVRLDYFIVMLLQKIEESPYAEQCVFKGGTSLSKCYPGTIERFSEDVDITLLLDESISDKQCSKVLRQVEEDVTKTFFVDQIARERNNKNKSAYVYFDEKYTVDQRIKLEIGSSVRPDPYDKRSLQTYIQEYLMKLERHDLVEKFGLEQVTINTLAIERTFLDKVMAVKRHAVCGHLTEKMRHVYDVTMLFPRDEIQDFLSNTQELKRLLQITKESDSFYLEKRNISGDYNPCATYDFPSWRAYLDENARDAYESLHETLLYTDEVQDFQRAVETFEEINHIFAVIGE